MGAYTVGQDLMEQLPPLPQVISLMSQIPPSDSPGLVFCLTRFPFAARSLKRAVPTILTVKRRKKVRVFPWDFYIAFLREAEALHLTSSYHQNSWILSEGLRSENNTT